MVRHSTAEVHAIPLEEATKRMRGAQSRDDVLMSFLKGAAFFVRGAQIFFVRQQQLLGLMALGSEGIDRNEVRSRQMSLKVSSVAKQSVAHGVLYMGPVQPSDPCAKLCDAKLLEHCGLVIVPVRLGARTPCVLIGHPRQKISQGLRDAMAGLGLEASLALARLIRRPAGQPKRAPVPSGTEATPQKEAVTIPPSSDALPSTASGTIEVPEPIKKVPTLQEPWDVAPSGESLFDEADQTLQHWPPWHEFDADLVADDEQVEELVLRKKKKPEDVVLLTAKKKKPSKESQTPELERRALPRYPVCVEVTYNSDHNFYTGFMEDLSEGGIFVMTYAPASLGDKFELNFSLPGLADPAVARCEVVWLREYDAGNVEVPGMGLCFLHLEEEAKSAIEAFIKERQPIFYDE